MTTLRRRRTLGQRAGRRRENESVSIRVTTAFNVVGFKWIRLPFSEIDDRLEDEDYDLIAENIGIQLPRVRRRGVHLKL